MFKKSLYQNTISICHSLIIPFFLLLFLGFSLGSCKEELSDLGADLLPESDKFNLSSDSTVVIANITSYKPIVVQEVHTGFASITIKSVKDPKKDSTTIIEKYNYSNYYYNILGEYKDEAFGSTSASLLFQITPSGYIKGTTAVIKPDSVVFVSLKLNLAKTDSSKYLIIGNANSPQQCQIYTLNDSILRPNDSTFYANDVIEKYKDKLVLNEPFLFDETQRNYYKYSLKFDLTNVTELMNSFKGLDTATMKSSSKFNRTILKGFYISSNYSNPGNGGIISALNLGSDSTYLELKYRTNASDTVIHSYKFYVSSFPMGLSHFKTEDRPLFDTAQYNFLQGLDSRCVKLDLQHFLDSLYQNNPMVSIHKAELTLTPDTMPGGLKYSNLPKQIYIIAKKDNDKDEAIDIDNRSYNQYDNYGGQYINKMYRFDITRYLQGFIKEKIKDKTFKSLGLILKVSNSFGTGDFDAGRIAFKKKGSIRLKIYYTKLNK